MNIFKKFLLISPFFLLILLSTANFSFAQNGGYGCVEDTRGNLICGQNTPTKPPVEQAPAPPKPEVEPQEHQEQELEEANPPLNKPPKIPPSPRIPAPRGPAQNPPCGGPVVPLGNDINESVVQPMQVQFNFMNSLRNRFSNPKPLGATLLYFFR